MERSLRQIEPSVHWTLYGNGDLWCDLKWIWHRLAVYIQMRLAYVSAMFNVLLNLFHSIHPDADPYKMSIAEFSL